MKRLFVILALLSATAAPALGSGNSGPKSWFHRKNRGGASSHYGGNHIIVKHHAAKHPKPHHVGNSRR
jgi:hypothetical protein